MYLDDFHTDSQRTIRISATQASRFAKSIAGDFNPIHNEGAKRFCVPGDLLFSLVLAKYGISPKMCFVFKGMVGDNTELHFAATDAGEFDITNTNNPDKTYMTVKRQGEPHLDATRIENLTRAYVAFSGTSFPHTLAPLLAKHGVMINPKRPMVIYERMQFEITDWDFQNPELQLSDAQLETSGKRGEVKLHFTIISTSRNTVVGSGFKKLLISGLTPHDPVGEQGLIDEYLAVKNSYSSTP